MEKWAHTAFILLILVWLITVLLFSLRKKETSAGISIEDVEARGTMEEPEKEPKREKEMAERLEREKYGSDEWNLLK